ncbi:MAG: MaoC family dehydratase N-terminal domain-containing protein [Gemmatimonadota bacterium]|nr:MaoC family dehydratase N-terminal domain-containing protein [Gemmatimonadota bacterium]
MQALLDRDPDGLREGDPLPLGWHWFYFQQPLRASSLGVDGHERRGAFMPEVDLPRRMWAGGTLRSLGPVRIGERVELRSRVTGVEEKRGKSGRLVFVTVGQTVLQGGRPCVEEEQVIVYRGAGPRPTVGASAPGPAREAVWNETFLPTSVTLFRFSALTNNAHRIHYDHPYATDEEGYPDLLVHGPLTALLLLDAAERHGAGQVTRFRYRALAPLFVGRRITLVGRPGLSRSGGSPSPAGRSSASERVVEALGPDGRVAMRGWVVCREGAW